MSKLSVENVSYRYKHGDRMVLSGVSCAFEPGQVTAVVGPSGSVTLDGEDLGKKDLDQYRRENVSVIFQAFQLFPLLSVMENVCYPMEIRGMSQKETRERAGQFLNRVGIDEEKWRRYPANLSGGEQQRVAIARSLASGARVLLADEPTGNLDGENSRNVVELLSQLAHEDGYCVVIVTHDPAIADASDRVYRMADGAVTQER